MRYQSPVPAAPTFHCRHCGYEQLIDYAPEEVNRPRQPILLCIRCAGKHADRCWERRGVVDHLISEQDTG